MRIIIFILILCLNHNNGISQSCIAETYTSQIGVREATGRNDGKQVEQYLKSVGLGKGYAWCSAFVRWCFDKCGVKTTINAMALSTHSSKRLVYYQVERELFHLATRHQKSNEDLKALYRKKAYWQC